MNWFLESFDWSRLPAAGGREPRGGRRHPDLAGQAAADLDLKGAVERRTRAGPVRRPLPVRDGASDVTGGRRMAIRFRNSFARSNASAVASRPTATLLCTRFSGRSGRTPHGSASGPVTFSTRSGSSRPNRHLTSPSTTARCASGETRTPTTTSSCCPTAPSAHSIPRTANET